jgi:LPS export ABC transporter permease LptG
MAVLVASLVCFGLLAKNHELTAFRACGVSLYRLAAPLLLLALTIGGLLFALDQRYLPETNRRQDAIRDEIKGRPVRTFLRADRQWTFGLRDRIFYHRFFDYRQGEIGGVNVYDFKLEPFALSRHIAAEKARWDPEAFAWVFENGWVREFDNSRVTSFEQFETREFSGIEETLDYFHKEEKQHQQMDWRELRDYIVDLTQAGFDTVRLQVQWHRKFAFPMFTFAMALLAAPFAMLTGSRGALAPVAFSLGLAIAFYASSALFEQLGRAGQMTPVLAAWAPGLLFSFAGAYLFLRVRT